MHVISRFGGASLGLVAAPDGAIYAAHSVHPNGGPLEVIRYVPGQGVTATSAPIPGRSGIGPRIAFAGDSVWVVGSLSGSSSLAYRLDATSLTALNKRSLPGVATAIATASSGLWVSSGRDLLHLDPRTGAVTSQVSLSGRITDIATDPAGEHLYASTDAPKMANDSLPLYELDASNGAVLRRVGAGTAELGGVGSLEATEAGVWLSAATGMMGYIAFFRASDLHAQHTPEGEGSATNAVRAAVTPGMAWRTDPSGQSLTCVDPTTGLDITQRLTSIAPAPPFVSTPAGIYAETWKGLARILPAPGCG